MKRLFITVLALGAIALVGSASALAWDTPTSARHDRGDFGMKATHPGIIGKIVSNSGGTLAIQLLNGSSAMGTVSSATHFFCIRHVAAPAPGSTRDSRDRGDRHHRGDLPHRGDRRRHDFHGFAAWEHARELAVAPCVSGDARPGRRVAGAELQTTTAGSIWRMLVIWA